MDSHSPARYGLGLALTAVFVLHAANVLQIALVDAIENRASRLERLTRVHGVGVIAGEDTHRAATGIEFREFGRVRVKGRDAPIAIYEPLGPADAIDTSMRSDLGRVRNTLASYRDRRRDDAERELNTLSRADSLCTLYRIYLERIAHYREWPPPDDRDGTAEHNLKYLFAAETRRRRVGS